MRIANALLLTGVLAGWTGACQESDCANSLCLPEPDGLDAAADDAAADGPADDGHEAAPPDTEPDAEPDVAPDVEPDDGAGFCATNPVHCDSALDCVLFSDYTPPDCCSCDPYNAACVPVETPVCSCLVEPCLGHTADCVLHECVVL